MAAAVSREVDSSSSSSEEARTPMLEAAFERLYERRAKEVPRRPPPSPSPSSTQSSSSEERVRLVEALWRCRSEREVIDAVFSVVGGRLHVGVRVVGGAEVYGTTQDSSGRRLLPMSSSDGGRERVPLGVLEGGGDEFVAMAVSAQLCRLWERGVADRVCDRLSAAQARGKAVAAQLVEKCEALERSANVDEKLRAAEAIASSATAEAVEAKARLARSRESQRLEVDALQDRLRRVEAALAASEEAKAESERRWSRARSEMAESASAAESHAARARKFDEAAKRLALRVATAEHDLAEATSRVTELECEVEQSKLEADERATERDELRERLRRAASDADAAAQVERQRAAHVGRLHEQVATRARTAQALVVSMLLRRAFVCSLSKKAFATWRSRVESSRRGETLRARDHRRLALDRAFAAEAAAAALVASRRDDALSRDALATFGDATRRLFAAASSGEGDLIALAGEGARCLAAPCDAARLELVGTASSFEGGVVYEVRSKDRLLGVLRLSSAKKSVLLDAWTNCVARALETRKALDDAARALREALAATRKTADSARHRAAAADRLVRAVSAEPTTPDRVARLLLEVCPRAQRSVVVLSDGAAYFADRRGKLVTKTKLSRDALELAAAARGVDPDRSALPSCLGATRVACVAAGDAALSVDDDDDAELLDAAASLVAPALAATASLRRRLRAFATRAARCLLASAWRRWWLADPPQKRRLPLEEASTQAASTRHRAAQTSDDASPSCLFVAAARRRLARSIAKPGSGALGEVSSLRGAELEACTALAAALDDALNLVDAYALLREHRTPFEESVVATALGVRSAAFAPFRGDLRKGRRRDVGGEAFFVERVGNLAKVDAVCGSVAVSLVVEGTDSLSRGSRGRRRVRAREGRGSGRLPPSPRRLCASMASRRRRNRRCGSGPRSRGARRVFRKPRRDPRALATPFPRKNSETQTNCQARAQARG